MESEMFVANEYISACGYILDCDWETDQDSLKCDFNIVVKDAKSPEEAITMVANQGNSPIHKGNKDHLIYGGWFKVEDGEKYYHTPDFGRHHEVIAKKNNNFS